MMKRILWVTALVIEKFAKHYVLIKIVARGQTSH